MKHAHLPDGFKQQALRRVGLLVPPKLGPPVERLESGYTIFFFSVV